MKKSLLIIFFTLFYLSSTAQITLQPQTGVKAGLNISNITIDEIDQQNTRYGYHLGLYSLLPLSQRWGVQFEIAYATKGTGITTNQDFLFGTGTPTEVEIFLNYFDIPVLAVYQLTDFINLNAGLYGNLLLSSQVEAIGGDITPNVELDDFNRFGVGWLVGVGFNVEPITLGLRYNRGITGIGAANLAETFLEQSRHSVIQMYLEFSFNNL
jgi:long-subunit fatty acid transport protein